MTRLRVFAGFALAFLIACGGGSTPSATPKLVSAAVIKDSFAKAVAAKSARMSMTIEITGTKDASGTITGSGVYSLADTRGVFTFDFGDIPGSPFEGKLEQRFLDGILYMKIPGLEDESGGKAWLKVDFEALSKISGFDLSQLSQLQSQDPTQTLAFLEAVSGNVRRGGTERVRDVETTMYSATVDLEKAVATLPQELRDQMKVLSERLNIKYVPIQVWIDGDGLVRRMSYAMDLSKIAGAGQGAMKATIELYDYGVPVSVSAPPASDVADFAEVFLNQ